MHYSTPDGYYNHDRLNEIHADNFLCGYCPLHDGENWRKRQKNKSRCKNKRNK